MPSRSRPFAAAAAARRSEPGPSLALACLGIFVVTLDAVIVSVALPEIGRDLRFAALVYGILQDVLTESPWSRRPEARRATSQPPNGRETPRTCRSAVPR
jgi:hypothetical protein